MSAVLGHFTRKDDKLRYLSCGSFYIVVVEKTSVIFMALSKT